MNSRSNDRPPPGGKLSGGRGPKPLADILGDLFAARGLARVRALGELEAAWADAVGEVGRRQTRVDGIRRGVLAITVAHPTLLEELASFRKPDLLAALRRSMAGTPIHDIRFQIGPLDPPARIEPEPGPGPPAPRNGRKRAGR